MKLYLKSFLFVVPILSAWYLFSPSLQFSYVWDDWLLVGPYSYHNVKDGFSLAFNAPLPFSVNYYRPLTIITYFLETRFVESIMFSHGFNIFLHCLNGFLLYLLVKKYWEARISPPCNWAASLVATIYIAHPAVMEGVVWVSGRFDLMVTFFLLLSLLSDLYINNKFSRAFFVSIFFLAALLCKEMAITFPVILLIFHFLNCC